ncbi:MAG: hypothetical protein LKG27_00990 [Clostridiaceae bacterium]|jgi:glycosyltransferase involved in cell wall biosynthesis|nr:hypothetical protein [Clostridiaceae bacterium]
MNKYSKYYPTIEQNKKIFEQLLIAIKDPLRSFDEKLDIANNALSYVSHRGTGYFYSIELEKFFVNLAQQYDIKSYDIEPYKNSFLHVMTECYMTGGHTRIVERWINQADSTQKHSVILLNHEGEIPHLLQKNIKDKNGELIILDKKKSQIERALELRELGMHYEHIILHTHMYDPIATIAFGTEKFTRPVILFNHADHMFWIGKSIADKVADIRDKTSISKTKRNIKNPFHLGLLADDIQNTITKDEARKILGIPEDKQVILTIGGAPKYYPIMGDNIEPILKRILDENLNAVIYAIGPKKSKLFWKKLEQQYQNRLIITGELDYENEYLKYLAAADLVVDSYPMCGFTVAIDVVAHNIPFLTLGTNTIGQLDFVSKTEAFCNSIDDLSTKAKQILNEKTYADKILDEEKELFKDECTKEAWQKRLEALLKETPKIHKANNLENETEPTMPDDLSVLIDFVYKKHFSYFKFDKDGVCYKRQGLSPIFEIFTYKKGNQKLKKICIFKIPVFKYSKIIRG